MHRFIPNVFQNLISGKTGASDLRQAKHVDEGDCTDEDASGSKNRILKRFRYHILMAPLSLCLTSALLHAQDNTPQQFDERLSALELEVQKRPFYNAPARPEIANGYNLFFTGDFLYWKAEENGLTYALKTSNATQSPLSGKLSLKDPHFEWDMGFRLGLGYNIPHDEWDIYANWTRFYTDAHGHTHAKENEGIYPVWAFPAGPINLEFVQKSKAHWSLFLNILDIELGKEYQVSKRLSLRPHLDLRTAWINQNYSVKYEILSPVLFDKVKMSCDYWGIGPRAGLGFQWNIVSGFSIDGDADISLIYGNDSLHQSEKSHPTPDDHLHFKEHMHSARAITDLGLFLSWDQMLGHGNYHFSIKAGWEQHIFFEQNQFFRFLDPFFQGSIVSNQGDLMLQGWTAKARIDF
ncbi:MAG: Lpg1974 family pore-forming outer membrane protein [Chlamydiota bacterium]